MLLSWGNYIKEWMLSHHIIAISFETIVDRWRLLHETTMLSFTLSFLFHVAQPIEGQQMPYPTRIGWVHCPMVWVPQGGSRDGITCAHPGRIATDLSWEVTSASENCGWVWNMIYCCKNSQNQFKLFNGGGLGKILNGKISVSTIKMVLKKSTNNAGEGAEKREPSYTVGGNAN